MEVISSRNLESNLQLSIIEESVL